MDDATDVDNVVTLPNLMNGRLAEVLAAAGGPALPGELRGELAARTAFLAAVDSWPSAKRHLLRTPAVVAVTTVATMLVATTGLAAASVLPGPAGRAVDGILGSVGVNVGSPISTPVSPSNASAPTSNYSAAGHVGIHHVGCSVGGTAATGSTATEPRTASCVITVPRTHRGTTGAAAAPPASPAAASSVSPASAPARTRNPTSATGGRHAGSGSSSGGGSSSPPTTLPGGGTTRGGNLGGGTCKVDTGSDGTTGSTTTTTDPTDSTTTTTQPSDATTPGCVHHGGHHGTGTTTTTTTVPVTS